MAETKKQAEEPKKSGSNKGLLIAFIIILAAINGIQLFFNLTQNNTIKEQTTTITENKSTIDSLNVQLDAAIKELNAKKDEIAQLGGDTVRLGEQIRQLILEKKQLQASSYNYQKKYNEIKDQIEAANRIREDADKEVDRLKELLAKQDTIITNQKVTIVQREDSIIKITSEKNKLAEKVAIASVLRADNFKIEALNAKGKADSDGEFKAKKIDKIRVTFTLAENKVAEKGGRDVYFRMIEPDGSALFDLANGGGSFQFEGKEIFYTMKQTILFENKGQKVTYEYKKGTPYKPGNHKIEIYCEGFKIGESSFHVK
ncbi:MAG TPA: hypothetical protein VNB90_04095 [Cytophagaceae bacterium]|jgi:cell division protein ZapB|nr:hypothetical protein [Cytophagaceae bacterium]